MSVDGVMVANAALAEVGLPPLAGRFGGHIRVRGADVSPLIHGMRATYRASVLGVIAETGDPAVLVRCHDCARAGRLRGTVPCTPARDVLRGVTCGRSS